MADRPNQELPGRGRPDPVRPPSRPVAPHPDQELPDTDETTDEGEPEPAPLPTTPPPPPPTTKPVPPAKH